MTGLYVGFSVLWWKCQRVIISKSHTTYDIADVCASV